MEVNEWLGLIILEQSTGLATQGIKGLNESLAARNKLTISVVIMTKSSS